MSEKSPLLHVHTWSESLTDLPRPIITMTPGSKFQTSSTLESDLLLRPLRSEYSLDDIPITSENQCFICHREVSRFATDGTRAIPLNQLIPRVIRYLQKLHPNFKKALNKKVPENNLLICMRDLQSVVQNRMSDLVEEDLSQHSRLQEDAMKHMGQYEADEESWQSQFERDRSFGEKAADFIARMGGSWAFLLGLWGFLLVWTM